MGELILHCKKVLTLIEQEYPYEKDYPGAVKKIYETINEIILNFQENRVNEISRKINFFSLVRNFVDQTTDYLSPILFELEMVEKSLNNL